jgi:N-acetylneuraminic acid mutarotase
MYRHSSRFTRLTAVVALAIALPAMFISSAVAQRGPQTADQMMRRAHDGRSVWLVFPGFAADVAVANNGQSTKGTLTVAADGAIELALDQPSGFEWAQRTLSSVVNHRLGEGEAVTGVEFADEDTNHPLGRLIKSKDPAEKSLWRAKGDMLTEVHRHGDASRMIISVAEVSRTADGKHLPRSYCVTTFDAQSGAIQSTRQLFNEWTKVGGYDLPTRLLAITSKSDGSRTAEEIVLTNHKLGEGQVKVTELPLLEPGITSFGAAVADGHLYVYGGHLGSPHSYSAAEQAKQLMRLKLAEGSKWEVVGEGPRRTGLAMVGYSGNLYRIGGWEAKNGKGEDWDLHSQADFARFDPVKGAWQDLAPLPAGRSSHDAALIGSKLYVVGGWQLAGKGDGEWHTTAYVCDLSEPMPQWAEITAPPFKRRALAVAGYAGKLYVMGGMDDSNDMSTGVDIYDPASKTWSRGPKLPGKPMDGFGASAFGTEQGLFAATGSGLICRLSADGKSWEQVGKLNHARMFHRLVADEAGKLLVVGGTSRGGKVHEVESLEVKLTAK